MPDHKEWYKLDLSAIVYPTLQRRDFSSVYRLSVLLKEEVQPEILQKALDQTLPRFPTYKAAIRKGLFWRYLEPNNRPGPCVKRKSRYGSCPRATRSAARRYQPSSWFRLPSRTFAAARATAKAIAPAQRIRNPRNAAGRAAGGSGARGAPVLAGRRAFISGWPRGG